MLTCLSAKPWAALLPLRESLALSMSPDIFVVLRGCLVGRRECFVIVIVDELGKKERLHIGRLIYLHCSLSCSRNKMLRNVIVVRWSDTVGALRCFIRQPTRRSKNISQACLPRYPMVASHCRSLGSKASLTRLWTRYSAPGVAWMIAANPHDVRKFLVDPKAHVIYWYLSTDQQHLQTRHNTI